MGYVTTISIQIETPEMDGSLVERLAPIAAEYKQKGQLLLVNHEVREIRREPIPYTKPPIPSNTHNLP